MNLTQRDIGTLRRANQILERMASYGVGSPKFSDPNIAFKVFETKIAHERREVFAVAYLNAQNVLIECVSESKGTLDAAAVYPREIARKCLELGAKSVILSHNHPSGNVEPSDADHRITGRIRDALELLDVNVLDHIIVVPGHFYSFASNGDL